jgi:hypothetical protein
VSAPIAKQGVSAARLDQQIDPSVEARVDCSPEALHAFFEDLFPGPEPEVESIGAAEANAEIARRR